MAGKVVLQEDVLAEVTPGGMVIISQRYDGPLGQDRYREIELSPTGAQALLDLLANGEAVEHSVQADAGCALCGHGIGYHNDPAVGHQYQEPVAQPRR